MNNPWLSIVIPAHNCRDRIERLLDSIVIQDTNNTEVIICDDNSIDNFMEKVEPYKDKLNVIYCKTKPRKIHCPGNTRLDGWKHTTGEWITFIDDDDMFEPNTFNTIKEIIKEKKETKLVFSSFRDYNYQLDKYNLTFDGGTWLHGKFYNRQWLIDEEIDFKENLYTNEDLYFNGLVIATLESKKIPYTKINFCSYKWTYNPDSFTRSFNGNGHSLLETYFNDYVTAAIEPWVIIYKKYSDTEDNVLFSHCCLMLLYMYFYIQAFLFSLGEDNIIKENIVIIKNIIDVIIEEYNKSIDDIIKCIYKDPIFYDQIKHDAEIGSNKFIETDSFKNFLYNFFK